MNRKKWSKEEKMAVVLQLLRGEKTIAQLCKEYGISESMAYKWRDRALEAMETALGDKRTTRYEGAEAEKNRLLKIIGEQACIIDLQKKIAEMI